MRFSLQGYHHSPQGDGGFQHGGLQHGLESQQDGEGSSQLRFSQLHLLQSEEEGEQSSRGRT